MEITQNIKYNQGRNQKF